MYAIFPYAQQHNGNFPKSWSRRIRDGALKMIIFEELVYQEALRRKMTVPAAKSAQREADFRKQFATPEEYQHVSANGVSRLATVVAGEDPALAVD